MKYLLILTLTVSSAAGYLFWQNSDELDSKAFQQAIHKVKDHYLLDVRSSNEFSNGHIPGAMNIDWTTQTFRNRIEELDTTKPIFIYCSTGARSNVAADYLRNYGFSSVTELKDGLSAWHDESFPETPVEIVATDEMTLREFSWMLDLEHDVLVDFYIPWNTDCQKMEPIIDDLSIEYIGKVKIMRVNIDTYKHLATELGIEDEGIPVLQFYENGNLTFQWDGITKSSIIKKDISTYIQSSVINF